MESRDDGAAAPQKKFVHRPECDRFARTFRQREQARQAKDDAWAVRTVAANGCFVSIPVEAPGAPEQGYWPLSRSEENVSAQIYSQLASQDGLEVSQGHATDADLKKYVEDRRTGLMLLAEFYGPPGVDYGQQALLQPPHDAVLKRLRERLTDPKFVATLDAMDRVEYRLLVDSPALFVPCKVKVGHDLRPPSNLASSEHVDESL